MVTGRPLKGRLLVATPGLHDPNFDRTVVLVLEHAAEGAVGVVLNRPSEVRLSTPLPAWEALAADPGVVFHGGPVQPGAAIGLARAAGPDVGGPGWSPVLGRLGTVDLTAAPDELGAPVEEVRVFSGYAGWAPGQLEGEVAAAAWVVVDAEPTDPHTCEPEHLWRTVLRRQRGSVAWLANFPPDLALN